MTTEYLLCAKTQLRFYRYELLWPLGMYDVIASIFYNSYLSLKSGQILYSMVFLAIHAISSLVVHKRVLSLQTTVK